GHSERREYNKETDAEVAEKFLAAKLAGLIPILCVGETHAQRLAEQTDAVVVSQLNFILSHHGADIFEGALLAYEPIWAIGTGLTATPEQAQAVHHLLRETIDGYDSSVAARLSILYGGSVKASNAAALFRMPDIDGALVGGASLQAEEFLAICESNK
ncbi:MAG TPA: triose-phosphate isomerase, partial [Candidatus Berkiella sp.]|nr:triose-phosphate isomerase [Candidatus Berkiella sp.]